MPFFSFQQPSSPPLFAGHSWNKFIVNWLFITSHLMLAESCFRQHSPLLPPCIQIPEHTKGGNEQESSQWALHTHTHTHTHTHARSTHTHTHTDIHKHTQTTTWLCTHLDSGKHAECNLVRLELDYLVNNAKLIKDKAVLRGTCEGV